MNDVMPTNALGMYFFMIVVLLFGDKHTIQIYNKMLNHQIFMKFFFTQTNMFKNPITNIPGACGSLFFFPSPCKGAEEKKIKTTPDG
jgi:hypothetical protein